MPRQPRLVILNCPHHIIQRGHNRQVVFVEDGDYLYYLDNLREWKTELGCKIYTYCLMTNHVHLIIDPGERIKNLGLLMKRVAGRQTRYVNKEEWKLIREATQRGQLISGKKFTREISEKWGRRIELRGPGRPKKGKK